MKNKLLSILLVGILVISLTGCNNSTEKTDDGKNTANITEDNNNNDEQKLSSNTSKTLSCIQNMNDAYNVDPYQLDAKIIFEWDLTGQIYKITEQMILSGNLDDAAKKDFRKLFSSMSLISDNGNKIILSRNVSMKYLIEDMQMDLSSEAKDIKNKMESETGYKCS